MDQVMDRQVALNIWDYRHGTVTSEAVQIADLFRTANDHYVPSVDVTPIK